MNRTPPDPHVYYRLLKERVAGPGKEARRCGLVSVL